MAGLPGREGTGGQGQDVKRLEDAGEAVAGAGQQQQDQD